MWPYDGTYPDLEGWEELTLAWEADTQDKRDAWRRRLEGPPPWRRDGEAIGVTADVAKEDAEEDDQEAAEPTG
jgi:hypothetical protein